MSPFFGRLLGAAGGGGGGTPRRYWRLNITANGGHGIHSIPELEMYAAPFGANLCVGGTPSASSESSGSTADEAFDRLLAEGSNWAATLAQTPPVWLAYDFGTSVLVQQVGLWGRHLDATQHPTAFDVQSSPDGVTWSTAWSVSGWAWSGTREFRRSADPTVPAFTGPGSPHGAHRYWRLFSSHTDGAPSVTTVAEVAMRATPGGVDQCSGGTASASSLLDGTNVAARAFDDNPATFWAGAGGINQWVAYDFGSAVSVAEVAITARTSSQNQTPRYGGVQWSDDGTNWTSAWHFTALGWAAGETRTFTDPTYIAP